MPLTLSCETDDKWNSNKLTVTDGVDMMMVYIHGENQEPHQGVSVSIPRREFFDLCTAYTRIDPPTDSKK